MSKSKARATDQNQRDTSTADNGPSRSLGPLHLNAKYLGLAFGLTVVVFYLGCMVTMATLSHDKAVTFFNSLLPGLDVAPILRTSVPVSEAALGLVTIFVLCWIAGALIAWMYNLGVRLGKQ